MHSQYSISWLPWVCPMCNALLFIYITVPVITYFPFLVKIRIVWSQKRQIYSFLAKLFFILLLANFFATCSLLYMSAHNYPGGYAFHQLHQLEKSSGLILFLIFFPTFLINRNLQQMRNCRFILMLQLPNKVYRGLESCIQLGCKTYFFFYFLLK